VSAIRRAIALIPAAVPVSASNEIGAHLSERRRIFRFPVYREADWVIIDSSDRSETATPLRLAPGLSAMRRDRRWRQIFRQDGVYVFAKRRA
jgi:hypothetical protein